MKPLQTMQLAMDVRRKKDSPFDSYFHATVNTTHPPRLNPIQFNSSGDITSTLNSHGLVVYSGHSSDLKAGDVVEFLSW